MAYYLTQPINIAIGQDVQHALPKICRALRIAKTDVKNYWLYRQSVDARKKDNVHFVCSYVVQTDKSVQNATPYVAPVDVFNTAQKTQNAPSVIVVGAGPAGLFSALYLAKCGCAVTVLERGGNVESRQQKVQNFFEGGNLDTNCNVQFGLGGAGTFSDGKLTSGISSPLTHSVFMQFYRSGAPKSILTDNLPHIGTDKLVGVVDKLRWEIEQHGGVFHFDTTVTDIIVKNGAVVGVTAQIDGQTKQYFADKTLICCGHSARDVFAMLNRHGVQMAFKPFAVGLRIEHSRQFINTAQYGQIFATHKDMPTASYKLVCNLDKGRSCYSFCMCPGGTVVPATSVKDCVVVNGMSNYARNQDNSNSALVVNVTAQDVAHYGFGDDIFAGVRFQQSLENLAYQMGGGNYRAPCQNVTDFIENKPSKQLSMQPSYCRGVTLCNLRNLLPQTVGDTIAQALAYFDGKIKGFGSSGVLTGVETRTSSPIKILRGNNFQANLANLYPVGEGAGYAGGIVSSAVDGLRVAMSILGKTI